MILSWTWIPIVILFALLIIGVPIGFSLLICSIPYFMLYAVEVPSSVIIQQMFANVDSSSMMAIPFFIAAGVIMNYSGVTRRLLDLCEVIVGHMKGSLAHVNILLSAVMGGMSGSAVADAAMQCKILVPEMEKKGYDREFCAAVTAASSLITPMIPPGTGLLIYAFCTNVSVGKMFVAGYVPGLMMTVGMMIYCAVVSKKRNYGATREKRASVREVTLALKDSLAALGLPVLLIVGLRMGVFTPTEGGAMCALYAAILGLFVYKEMTWKDFGPIMLESVLATAAVMTVMCATKAFGYYLTWERLPHMLSTAIASMGVNKYVFLMIVNVVLLIMGMFIEGTSMCLIMAPLLLPVLTAYGIDLVHFGIVMVMNMTIGALTPPFGSVLYTVCPLMEIRVMDLAKALVPFILIMLGVLLISTYFPAVITFLPNLIYGR